MFSPSRVSKGCLFGATERRTDGQTNIRTDSRPGGRGRVGVLEAFVMDLQSSQYFLSKVRRSLCIMDETDEEIRFYIHNNREPQSF